MGPTRETSTSSVSRSTVMSVTSRSHQRVTSISVPKDPATTVIGSEPVLAICKSQTPFTVALVPIQSRTASPGRATVITPPRRVHDLDLGVHGGGVGGT